MHELLIMLNLKAQSFLKRLFVFKWTQFVQDFSSLLIFGGFAVGVFALSRSTTMYLLNEEHIGQFLFHRFLSMLLYVFFITVNLGNMLVSYATLYKSQEVNFLMALPISHTKIFLIKFIDNFFYSSSTLSLMGLAVLLGYGSCFDLPWYFYFFTIFFIMVPFMLIAGIIAVLVLMSLIKIATRIGVRWLLAIMVTVYLSAIYAYFKIINPVRLVQDVMQYFPNVNQYFGDLDPPFVKVLPNHWVTEFLYWSVNNDYGRALPHFVVLFLMMLGLMVVAVLVAQRYYYESWLVASDSHAMAASPRARFRLRMFEFGKERLFTSQTEVLFKRDFWLFVREPSQWLHLILMLLLMMIFIVSVGALELKLVQPFLQAVAVLIVFLFNGFLIASIALRFVFPTVSLESDSFWCVRSAPVSMKRLYWQKLLIAILFVLPVALLLSFVSVSMLRGHALVVLVTVACSGMVALTLTGLNLGAGTHFAVFKEKNPIRIASSQGASLTFLCSMLYIALVVGFLVAPLHNYFQLLITRGMVSIGWVYVPLLSIAALSLLVFWLSTSVGLKAINRDV